MQSSMDLAPLIESLCILVLLRSILYFFDICKQTTLLRKWIEDIFYKFGYACGRRQGHWDVWYVLDQNEYLDVRKRMDKRRNAR